MGRKEEEPKEELVVEEELIVEPEPVIEPESVPEEPTEFRVIERKEQEVITSRQVFRRSIRKEEEPKEELVVEEELIVEPEPVIEPESVPEEPTEFRVVERKQQEVITSRQVFRRSIKKEE